MRYFHRTSASPERVLEAAKGFFGGRLTPAEESPRRRVYHGTLGRITISARPEGGHYTFVEVHFRCAVRQVHDRGIDAGHAFQRLLDLGLTMAAGHARHP